jgi:hypothetical protein
LVRVGESDDARFETWSTAGEQEETACLTCIPDHRRGGRAT